MAASLNHKEFRHLTTLCLLLLSHPFFTKPNWVSSSINTIHSLPGFSGPLPFKFETGYIEVDEEKEVELFYYFIESEGDPREDPLVLWLTGGPGCSGLSGLLLEIGPLKFNIVNYNGSLPTFVLNPYSWTKVSSIIFLDAPVGTGFSYSRSSQGYKTTDMLHSYHCHTFMRKWLLAHPSFISNPLYIAGDSYSGLVVPIMVEHISKGNDDGLKPAMNIKGYVIGNPLTDTKFDINSRIPFAHRVGLISDELYKSVKKTCKGEYRTFNRGTPCGRDIQAIKKCIDKIYWYHILERCVSVPPELERMDADRRHLQQKYMQQRWESIEEPFECRIRYSTLLLRWADDIDVQRTLHAHKEFEGPWRRCNTSLLYTQDVQSSLSYHGYLNTKGFRALIYSGDHDLVIPYVGTHWWIKHLNLTIVDPWRPWLVDEQVGGYVEEYSNFLTFATVKGGGHTAPEYMPKESFAMLKRYIEVDEEKEVELFYYFIESEGDPREDPLVLWLTGGPGCSALSGLFLEIGPLKFNIVNYNGSLPTFVLNPYSWTKVSSIIFLDAPVGTGFSYSRSSRGYKTTDMLHSYHCHIFMRKWLLAHPNFISNPLYIAGDSYSGLVVPIIVEHISKGNDVGLKPAMSIKGYVLGNPATDPKFDTSSKIPFAHRVGLISDELYKSVKRTCKGEYRTVHRGTPCGRDLQAIEKCIDKIYQPHILEHCASVFHELERMDADRRYLQQKYMQQRRESTEELFECRISFSTLLLRNWADDIDVQRALHAHKETKGPWKRCNRSLLYTKDVQSSLSYHRYLNMKGFRALIYSGDHDLVVPYVGTHWWIKHLNFTIVDGWRPWLVNEQVGGYAEEYSNFFTFATVKGGGHTAPEYQPKECFAMFKRWLAHLPL